MREKIEIDNQTIARFWLILLLFVGGLVLLYWARTALLLVGIAVFLATAINPLVSKLAQRLFKDRRAPATAVVFAGLVVLIGLVGLIVVPTVVDQTVSLIKNAPDIISNSVRRLTEMNSEFDKWNIKSFGDEIIAWIDVNKANWAAKVGSSLFTGIGSVASSLLSTIVVLVLVFLISLDAPMIIDYFFSFYSDPKLKKRHQDLGLKMYRVVVGFVSGQLIVALLYGLLASVLTLLLSVLFELPASIVAPIGLVSMLFAFVPVIGSTAGLIVGGLLILVYSWQAAIVFLMIYVIYQQLDGNLITPAIQSTRVDMSTLIVMLAIILGIYMFGVLGGVIAIPLAGCVRVLVDDYRARQRHILKQS